MTRIFVVGGEASGMGREGDFSSNIHFLKISMRKCDEKNLERVDTFAVLIQSEHQIHGEIFSVMWLVNYFKGK